MSKNTNKYQNVHIVNHPIVIDSLSHLRDKKTKLRKFRFHSDQICNVLFAEAIRGLKFKKQTISTPLSQIKAHKLKDEIIVIPVLRSGIAMLFGAMHFLPKSKIGFIGLERDEETAIAQQYYWKLPKITKKSVIIVTDPMLATGGSILHILRKIANTPAQSIRIVTVVCAPEGIKNIQQHFPNIQIFTAAVDSHLNKTKFIVPGLGDYGDRYFGTE